MLHGIGIYEVDFSSKKMIKKEGAPLSRFYFSFNPLAYIEKILQTTSSEDLFVRGTAFAKKENPDAREINYLLHPAKGAIILAISSKTPWEPNELASLFAYIYIGHFYGEYFKTNHLKLTLEDILVNPLGYLNPNMIQVIKLSSLQAEILGKYHNLVKGFGGDIKISSILMTQQSIIESMHQNIEKVIDRGEHLDSLKEKTIRLSDDSVKFEKSARDLNRCCGWW